MLARAWNKPSREADDPAGTHVPFTAPLLSGVCVRANRDGLDFLLPNPSGGRGTYVVGWRSVVEYASPTLHDVMLATRLSELASLDPPTVRATAQDVALEGYAGRLAADAGLRGRSRIETERLQLWSRLLMALLGASPLPTAERTVLLQNLGQAGPGTMTVGLNALARRLDWEPATLFDGLGRLSASHAPLVPNGRVSILIACFERLRSEVAAELGRLQADRGAGDGPGSGSSSGSREAGQSLPSSLRRMLPDLDHCLRHGRGIADAAALTLEQPLALLESWRVDPAIPLEVMERLEHALDGWDRIALLWRDCGSPSARSAVLPEIALLLRLAADRIRGDDPAPGQTQGPTQETTHGPGKDQIQGDRPAGARAASNPDHAEDRGHQGKRPTTAPALVERNERIRALELDLEACNG